MTKYTVLILIAGFAFLISSCHSEYVCLNYETHHGAQWNPDHSKIAFVASKYAYRAAEGIAKFPDGGIPDYLISNTALYIFDPRIRQLSEIAEFNDLADRIGANRSTWNAKIAFTDSVLFYNVIPVSPWNLYLNQAANKADSLSVHRLKEKYSPYYCYNLNSNSTSIVDSIVFFSVYNDLKDANKAGLTDLNRQLSEIPLKDWGLVIQEIYPKPDKDYIEETIYLNNNSATSRRAVIEQIISKLPKQEIQNILNKMDVYKNSLEGLKRKEYELYSKDTYDRIKALL
ncbi:MAG: hypothetical protein JXR46_13840 [Calditrichaceae bacterium]|nr:hypothetical protein [Calditrichaceae bacterium]MBN2710118.1 hypothetical protein [Calditrichaceae bacterium]RQV93434.1 MAG: hypothetical protein EH224_12515 [Calditrichota bacterium]